MSNLSNKSNFDIIIVGGGISGLYSAYKILQMASETKLLVLVIQNLHVPF